jgi:hypothetical protein
VEILTGVVVCILPSICASSRQLLLAIISEEQKETGLLVEVW